MKSYDIALIGGDARTAYMIPYLLKNGYRVIGYGLFKNEEFEDLIEEASSLQEAICSAGCVVGGIPLFKGNTLFHTDNLQDMQIDVFNESIRKGQVIFGGILSEAFLDVCVKKGIICYDFMKNEPYVIENAIATAEGSILEALSQKNTTIHGSRALVLGYGRCGKVLADKLKGLNARVSVCSREKEELAYAKTSGLITIVPEDLVSKIDRYEYIFNTIPAPVMSKEVLKNVCKNALIIDIASAPGGVDDAAAKEEKIKVLHSYGLPGKYAPRTAAEGLAEYVIQAINKERG